jgi:ferredoxin-NADP reductase
MLPLPLSTILGILFVLIGAAAVWLMFDASSRAPNSDRARTMIQAHRVAGYLFAALFCFMTWFMILRIREGADNLPPATLLHTLLAIVLAPLIFVKILVARHYKKYTPILVPLGLTIFVLAFVLVVTTAGPYLLRTRAIKEVSLQAIDMGTTKIDLRGSESLVQQRCSRCHTLDRVLGARKDAQGWLATVNRMRRLPGSGISEGDVKVILSYLLSENSIDSTNAPGALAVGKALVDSHCGRCHALDRTYESSKTAAEWDATVTRMVKHAHGTEGFFKPGEPEQIIRFLSATQTPEAVRARAASVSDAAPDDTHVRPKAESADGRAPTWPSIGLTVLIAAVFGILIRRPRTGLTRVEAGPRASIESRTPPVLTHGATIILQLVRSENQTHDCICLRLRIASGARLQFRPGQFLTFAWLIDGKKLVRCYSISSSPTQSGFVEITVKKQENGCVSPYLNERAAIGLTVEARGPFGQFHFDEQLHKKIVLFAGGSGITPMMSMLRYIDDLALDTQVTLFYSVRTRAAIIFAEELGNLEERVPGFRRVIVLTRPDDGWFGASGRVSRELIAEHLSEIIGHTFFLCGPQSFMDHVDGILRALGVPLERIMRESFVGIKTNASGKDAEESVGAVDFVGSGRTSSLSPGQTLLDAADAAGVPIPSACRQGRCGTCATRLLEGEVRMASEEGLDPALKAQGYVLTCVARAQGKVYLDA